MSCIDYYGIVHMNYTKPEPRIQAAQPEGHDGVITA
jgi:hypothetical protein